MSIQTHIHNHYASERGLVRLWLAHLESFAGRTREFEQVDFSRVERLVFVCLGNICRSPFAEFIAKKNSDIPTAGFGISTTTGEPAFPLGLETAKKFDIDMTRHRTTDFKDFRLRDSDMLLAMEVRHARRLKTMIGNSRAQIGLLGHWAKPRRLHIHDPHQHDAVYFENCYQILQSATRSLIEEFKG